MFSCVCVISSSKSTRSSSLNVFRECQADTLSVVYRKRFSYIEEKRSALAGRMGTIGGRLGPFISRWSHLYGRPQSTIFAPVPFRGIQPLSHSAMIANKDFFLHSSTPYSTREIAAP